jgi:RecQ family ATP-dependent DNA helicase
MANTVISQTTPQLKAQMLAVLRQYFQLDTFRPKQLPIITDIINGHDMLVLLPTGSGKSLCYQLPAMMEGGFSIVISPLLALINDQIEFLKTKGIGCGFFNSQSSKDEKLTLFNDLKKKDPLCRLLYTTPETLNSNLEFQSLLQEAYHKKILNRIVIDEAHCVSNWGHDFRDAYLQLKNLKTIFPKIQVVSLTATATPKVKMDIIKQLRLKSVRLHRQSFVRPNLCYEVRTKTKSSVVREMANLIKTKYIGQSGIIYSLSRPNCEDVAEELQNLGVSAEFFHAGLNSEAKAKIQADWLSNEIQVIVATIAFGLGINKPDVRFVFHHCMPKSIEGYYQETGRAGRDCRPSDCILFYSGQDRRILEWIINKNASEDPDNEAPTSNLALIDSMTKFCKNNIDCRKAQLSHYLGEYIDYQCGLSQSPHEKWCDNCISQSVKQTKNKSPSAQFSTGVYKEFLNQLLISQPEWELEQLITALTKKLPLTRVDQERFILRLLVHGHLIHQVKTGALQDIYVAGLPLVTDINLERLEGDTIMSFVKPKQKPKPKAIFNQTDILSSQVSTSSISQSFGRLEIQALRTRLQKYQKDVGSQIITNEMISELCDKRPKDHMALLQINGFDSQKICEHGDPVLDLVQQRLL